MLRCGIPKRLVAVNVTAIARCGGASRTHGGSRLAAVLDSPKMSFAEAGRRGARARFGPLRTVHLNSLDPVTAGIIRAILAARENAKAAPDIETGAAMSGGTRDAAPTS